MAVTGQPGNRSADKAGVAGGMQPNSPPDGATVPAADGESHRPSVHQKISAEKRQQGDELAAAAHLIAAQALSAEPDAAGPVRALCNVATGYLLKGDHATAARWYRLVIKIDPGLAVAYQNLASIYLAVGRDKESATCRHRAYQIQRVFIDGGSDPVHRVLVLCAGQKSGNLPYKTLMLPPRYGRIQYAIDYAAESEDAHLPPYDLVFNAIGEPDIAVPLADRLNRFVAACRHPLFNHPGAVVRTQRHHLAGLLGGIDGIVAPPCARFDHWPGSPSRLATCLTDLSIDLPVLARPAESHGGEGLVRCDTWEALESWCRARDRAYYVTAFRDCRWADGYYRKFRMIFIDRRPYPYHLAISLDWLVHYFSAEMQQSPWKIEEERRFLLNSDQILGSRAIAALSAIARRLDLDYAGIDFTQLPDGRLFIFEANATMLVHPERDDGPLAHKNRHVQAILDAFNKMLIRRAKPRHPIAGASL